MKAVCAVLCLLASMGLAQPAASETAMSLDAMKTLSRQALEMWEGSASIDPSIFAPDYRNHQEPLADGGVQAIDLVTWVKVVETNHSAFPDLAVTIIGQVAEGDRVSTHWRFSGTQQGVYEGEQPAGKPVNWTGVSIDRFADGRIAETWVVWDKFTLFGQLGLIESK